MTERDIDALKRRGRLLARDKGIGRQKALDLIAIEEGHRHWGALLASLPKEPISDHPTDHGDQKAAERDWAIDHLDIMSGARTSTIDEAALSAVGSIATRFFGTGILGACFASACAAMLITLLYQASKFGNVLATFRVEDVVMPMIDVPLAFVVAALCWHSPHSVRFRRIRHTGLTWCTCLGLFWALSCLSNMRDAVFTNGPSPLEGAMSSINLMGPVIAAMWIGTYAGRRRIV